MKTKGEVALVVLKDWWCTGSKTREGSRTIPGFQITVIRRMLGRLSS